MNAATINSKVYLIIPTSKSSLTIDQCTEYPCHTLDDFTQIPKHHHKNLIIKLHFLPGIHILRKDYSLGYPAYIEKSLHYNSSKAISQWHVRITQGLIYYTEPYMFVSMS